MPDLWGFRGTERSTSNHYFIASGIHAEPGASEFLEHTNEEQVHAHMVAQRITQLQGEPSLAARIIPKQEDEASWKKLAAVTSHRVLWPGSQPPVDRNFISTVVQY